VKEKLAQEKQEKLLREQRRAEREQQFEAERQQRLKERARQEQSRGSERDRQPAHRRRVRISVLWDFLTAMRRHLGRVGGAKRPSGRNNDLRAAL
jgi:hypothetical protein